MKRYSEREPSLLAWLLDIRLLGSIWLARFMVWRELRREKKEVRELRRLWEK